MVRQATTAKMPAVVKPLSLVELRHYAVARSLFVPTTLPKALVKLGYVQADPIRAPARAQDLTLRHRVAGYRAGDLDRRYPSLAIEEDFFVNYGFVGRDIQALMHPRVPRTAWPAVRASQAQEVLDFVRARGQAHPRQVDAHFAHGKVRNWFGGSSNACTELLDAMHYRGLLRIARRDSGVRVYAAHSAPSSGLTPAAAMDALIDVVLAKYAPLPAPSLGLLASHLCGGVPQWADLRGAALTRAKARCASTRLDGIDWYWPADESPISRRHASRALLPVARLLAPFDPVVWDRRRFEALWGWAYRFEAYTPASKRLRGYYALPLLWRDSVVGWGNLSVVDGHLQAALGYASGQAPADPAFALALNDELARMSVFLGLPP